MPTVRTGLFWIASRSGMHERTTWCVMRTIVTRASFPEACLFAPVADFMRNAMAMMKSRCPK
jgi:hypothetical protein